MSFSALPTFFHPLSCRTAQCFCLDLPPRVQAIAFESTLFCRLASAETFRYNRNGIKPRMRRIFTQKIVTFIVENTKTHTANLQLKIHKENRETDIKNKRKNMDCTEASTPTVAQKKCTRKKTERKQRNMHADLDSRKHVSNSARPRPPLFRPCTSPLLAAPCLIRASCRSTACSDTPWPPPRPAARWPTRPRPRRPDCPRRASPTRARPSVRRRV